MSKLATNPIAAPSDELRAFLSTQEMPEDAEAAWYNRGATGTALRRVLCHTGPHTTPFAW
eukprot:30313-Pelagococcus_subviridis.AAC.1